MAIEGTTERSPLLSKNDSDNSDTSQPQRQPLLKSNSTTSIPIVHIPKVHSGQAIINVLSVTVFLIGCGFGTLANPMTQLVEEVVCHQHYNLDRAVIIPADDAARCKIPAIQSRVAYIFSNMQVADAIVGLMLAVPWGIIADRIGRRPVFLMALTGLLLSVLWQIAVLALPNYFNPDLLVLESLFRVIGGGEGILLSIISSMIADSIATEHRSTAFARIHVAVLVGTAIAPALTAGMMSALGSWPVIGVAVAYYVAAAFSFLFVPESLPQRHAATNDPHDDSAEVMKPTSGWTAPLYRVHRHLSAAFGIFSSRSIILLLLALLLTGPTAPSLGQFLSQFVSKKYELPYSRAGYVQAMIGIVQALVLLCLLPWLSSIMLASRTPTMFRRADEQTRDLTLVRWSAAISGIGFFILGLAPSLATFIFSLVILNIGSATTSLLRGIISLYVDPQHTSRLYSVVAMVEIIGQIYTPPMLASLFSAGMNLDVVWSGLPYLVVAALCVADWLLLLVVRVPAQKSASDEAAIGDTSSAG